MICLFGIVGLAAYCLGMDDIKYMSEDSNMRDRDDFCTECYEDAEGNTYYCDYHETSFYDRDDYDYMVSADSYARYCEQTFFEDGEI